MGRESTPNDEPGSKQSLGRGRAKDDMGMARENSPSRSTTEPPGGFLRVDRCPRSSGKEGEKVRTATSTLCDGLTNYQIYVISDP